MLAVATYAPVLKGICHQESFKEKIFHFNSFKFIIHLTIQRKRFFLSKNGCCLK